MCVCVCVCDLLCNCSLEVTLEKKEQDLNWTSLFDDGRGYSHMPHGERTDLKEDVLQKKLDGLQSEKKDVSESWYAMRRELL